MPLERSHDSVIRQPTGGLDDRGFDRLVAGMYGRLRELAHHRLRAAPLERSLNTTGLVHEAYLRMAGSPDVAFVDREHFLALASRVMRNVLVDQARARGALKRGQGLDSVPLDEEMWVAQVDLDGVADLDEALTRLETIDARQGEIVELRYFGGFTLEETAEILNLSLATVKRDLRLARAWLAADLTRASA
jgi:RNA polymerase sigma factor (TIGR02999 family)